ncbi:MAG TPA: PD-(D/E)XK nuclease family protein [Firmicutes bacterium]|nr:PD-(D/E)XK nuclease family protein [Bacillota bacterium]
MAYVRTEYPQWSWSFSRQQIFASCRRRYYYNYYASHNGWEQGAPPEAALAYRLKKLSNIYTVLGDAVHKCAQSMVERLSLGRSLPSAEAVEEEIRRQLRRVWKSSRDDRDLFLMRPNRVDMLHEFYYGRGVSESVVERINQRIVQASEGLVNSSVWDELAAAGAEVISCEQFDTILIADTPVYAVPDLVFRKPGGEWVVVDWKTGEEAEENRDQVALYVLFVHKKYQAPVEQITARLEYLNLKTKIEMRFDVQDVRAVEQSALESMERMRELLRSPELNAPQPKGSFPLTEDRDQCPWCSFYELCQEELERSVS